MLKDYLRVILQQYPEYAAIAPVIEKEILHHDIMYAMLKQGALQQLTFIGGTSLRLCYNSSRLSEDLNFNGGVDFSPAKFSGLEYEIKEYLQKKYETEIWVNKPQEQSQSNTSSWKISIEKEANRPDLPRQKMHIDVCAIPSFDVEKRPVLNHYNLDVPTEGLLIPVQSLSETLVDKFIALAYRSRRIKPRDIWDIVWLHQQSASLDGSLLRQKLDVRQKEESDFQQALMQQVARLSSEGEVREDFNQEMSRFIPSQLKERTLDNPDYWLYLVNQIEEMSKSIIDIKPSHAFDMSM